MVRRPSPKRKQHCLLQKGKIMSEETNIDTSNKHYLELEKAYEEVSQISLSNS